LVGKPEGKRPLERPMHRWKMNLGEIGWECMVDWMHLDQDRDEWQALVNMVMNHWVS
jgi:hypothetical protein